VRQKFQFRAFRLVNLPRIYAFSGEGS
jgi:hypothetical protein